MGLDFSNFFGAASKLKSSLGKEKSLKSFLNTITDFGLALKCKFEINFSGIEEITFFATSIQVPGVKLNTGQLYFDGRMVEVPILHEYEHDFNITLLNDNNGYLYTAIKEFIMSDWGQYIAPTGHTMTIKSLGDDTHKGATITLNGVRLKTLGPLSFSHEDTDVQTFDVGCSAIDTSSTPGALDNKATGIMGALASIIS